MSKLRFAGQGLIATGVLFVLLLLIDCGGGSSSSPPPPSTVTSVSVSANATLLRLGQGLRFTQEVQGTGNYFATTCISVLYQSTVRRSPSSKLTNGLYPRSFSANVMSARECLTSPSRSAAY